MHQEKSTLSQLVQRAAAGETVLIGPNGHAIAKLTSLDAPRQPKRCIGIVKGKLVVLEDFDAPIPDDHSARQASPFRAGKDSAEPGVRPGELEFSNSCDISSS